MLNLILNIKKLLKLKKRLGKLKKIIGNNSEKKKQLESDLKGRFCYCMMAIFEILVLYKPNNID